MSGQVAPLLRVEGLGVSFAALDAVRDVSFSLNEGEILGIVGESGSGKSLTCRAILGLQPPTAVVRGSIRFRDRELLALRPDQWRALRGREIAMIFQNPSSHLDPLMPVGAQVAEGLRFHLGKGRDQSRWEAVDLLRSVRINDAEKRARAYPHELSGGMKQRGLIAAAMACRPRLLLADEPTTALDVTVQARILDLLREMNAREGVAVILVSHDLGVVAELCHRVAVMRGGSIVEEGPVRNVMARPAHPYTKLLIDSQPSRMVVPRVAASPTGAPLIEVRDLGVSFAKPGWLPGRPREVVHALDGVTLTVVRGESLGIVGESGSGKSTLARVLTGLVPPSQGEALFDGRSIAGFGGKELVAFRRAVQMVFQNPYDALNPRLCAVDAVAEPLLRHRLASRRQAMASAQEILATVELSPELWTRRPGELSGGQCQRVGIARALVLGPQVLIADEITSALDVTVQAGILALLQRLRAERSLTLVYISHDLAVVRRLCDRIAVFRAAQLVEMGSAAEVLERPRDDYTRELIASAPRMERALQSVGEERA